MSRSRHGVHGRAGLALALAALACAPLRGGGAPLYAQEIEGRPIPERIVPPQGYRTALQRGWRTEEGTPGSSYWQQGTVYELEARLHPDSALLEAEARIRYAQNAPITLQTVWLHLYQNFHAEGAARHEPAEITGGIELARVVANGQELSATDSLRSGPGYRVQGTLMELRPPAPVAQGDTLVLEIEWSYRVPEQGIGARMGHSDHEVYLLAYWFPKVAVLDDLHVWDAQPFLGNGEFYDDFASDSAALTVPAGWTVMATGTLQNPQEVFSALTLERLEAAATSDTLVTIAGTAEREIGAVTAETPDGTLTYRFTADEVRDFAWTASNVQRWDATSAVVADRDGDGEQDRVLVHAFWREDRAPLWSESWRYGKQAIEFHSGWTQLPYPWPHMTLVEGDGIIGGGMEFPMMTLIGSYSDRDGQALFNTTSHEIAHMWLPMIVGTNEKRWAWMDEGSANFIENESRMELWPGVDHHRVEARTYLQFAESGQEQTMMRHADWYEPGNGYVIASYYKPAALMEALRGVLGEETWEAAYRAFIAEWAFKHPAPWDFFSTFERFAGRDLDWFWSSYYYETWTMDHAVREVRPGQGGSSIVVIEDLGYAFFPSQVRIRTADGGDLLHEIPVEHWLEGNTTYEIEVESGRITRVEIDPQGFSPDVNRRNNLWPRG
ncbi:MAG TPA: M1 family metallopeptidase [Longimicrobiales bacterium]|nr:M1 family metallopeptidase [Longimicrobiales bacterium]